MSNYWKKLQMTCQGRNMRGTTPTYEELREGGFTLLETTISLVLMMIVGLGAASLFMASQNNNVSANDRQLSMAVAQQHLEALRATPFTDASLNAATVDSDVTSAGRPYRVTTIISDSEIVNGSPTIKTITVRVIPQGNGPVWARTITSLYGSVTITTQRTTLLLGPNRSGA
jgi:type II secretory pathway pseudopilin PulG